jgi:hypothetical protein
MLAGQQLCAGLCRDTKPMFGRSSMVSLLTGSPLLRCVCWVCADLLWMQPEKQLL